VPVIQDRGDLRGGPARQLQPQRRCLGQRPPRRPSCRPFPLYPAVRSAGTPAAEHGSRGSARSADAAQRSYGSGRPPGHAAGNQTRTRAARRTAGNPGAGTPPARRPPHTHRPAAGTAIRWPRATHRLGSLPATVTKPRRGGIPHVNRDGKILAPRAGLPGGNIVNDHRRERRPDCFGNQAVNTRYPASYTRRPAKVPVLMSRLSAAFRLPAFASWASCPGRDFRPPYGRPTAPASGADPDRVSVCRIRV
jgi:hypothetical protein